MDPSKDKAGVLEIEMAGLHGPPGWSQNSPTLISRLA